MPTPPLRSIPRALLGLLLLLSVGCLGDETPSSPESTDDDELLPPPTVDADTEGWLVRCTVDPAAGSFDCGHPSGSGQSGAQAVIVGDNGGMTAGDGYVTLDNDPVEISGTTLSADVWVQNLLPQPLGATDLAGTNATGIRVFFHTLPDNGVTVGNPDGTGTFTGSGQPFFQYDRVAQAFDRTVRKTWEFSLPNPSQAFTFEVYVEADVPYPDGWVEIDQGDDGLSVSEELQLTATARNVVGELVEGRTFTWATSDAGVVSVGTSSGLATGVAPGGPAVITATSDGPEAAGLAGITVGGNDIAVALGVLPDAVDEGGVLTHFLSVTNHGPDDLTSVRVRLDIATGVYRVFADPQCTPTGNQPQPGTQGFNCDFTFLPSTFGPQTGTAFVEVRASDAAIVTSTATLDQINSSDDLSSDPRSDNNVFEATTIVEDVPDGNLTISLDATPSSVDAGTPVDYTITVDNNGGSPRATRVVVDLWLDDNGESSLVGSLPSNCEETVTFADPLDTVFRCDLGFIAAGASGSATSPVLSVTPGAALAGSDLDATATFRVIEGMYDPDAVDESATATVTVNAAPAAN